MMQHLGFEDIKFSGYVCKLRKVIYGLKQASQAWFNTLVHALVHMGFTKSKVDASLFMSFTSTSTILLLVYVDDIIY